MPWISFHLFSGQSQSHIHTKETQPSTETECLLLSYSSLLTTFDARPTCWSTSVCPPKRPMLLPRTRNIPQVWRPGLEYGLPEELSHNSRFEPSFIARMGINTSTNWAAVSKVVDMTEHLEGQSTEWHVTCYRYGTYIVILAVFTAVTPLTDLVTSSKQAQWGRTQNHRHRRNDYFPRTRRTQLSVRVKQSF